MARRKKRRSAWASITELDKGQRYRIRYWAETPEGYRRKSETVRGTRMDAERRRSELMLLHSEDAPCPTVGQAWERWVVPELEHRVEAGTLAVGTLKQYQGAWRTSVAPTFADMPCDEVRPLRVQQWLDTLTRSQAAQGVKAMGKVMDAAVRYEVVDHNPMRERYVMPSRSTVEGRDKGIWTLSELGELWRQVHGRWYEPAFILAAFGGLRFGESLGVVASDVELRGVDGVPVALVAVERQMPQRGTRPVDRLKTEQSRRVAVVVGLAALRLAEVAASMPPHWPLSGDGLGGYSAQIRLTRAWDGMAHPFRNLRNSWQTWMRWEAHVAPWCVETLMGHAGAGVTAKYYDRPTADVLAAVVADAYRVRPWDARWPQMGRDA